MTSVAANRLANQFLLDINDYEIDDLVSLKQFVPTDEDPLAVSYTTLEIRLDFLEETEMVTNSGTGVLVDHLNILLCQGTLNDAAHDSVAQIIEDEITTNGVKAQYTILALLSSPDCAVQE